MPDKYRLLFSVLILFVVSCSKSDQFPAKRFEKVDKESVVLNQSFIEHQNAIKSELVQGNRYSEELSKLLLEKEMYDKLNSDFDLAKMENGWNGLQSQKVNFSFESTKEWIEITGFLLEIKGDCIYAGELEEIIHKSFAMFSNEEYKEIEDLIIPWIFTKNVDHIQINLFVNSTIKYDHTLKGAVEITQETNYPESGKVQIKFKMENKRYIELFIRIPEWAENVSIIEKGVKYVATPGRYSQIVRKWKDGNVVEIEFSMDNKPDWLK